MGFERVAALDEISVGTASAVEVGGEPVCLVRTDDATVKAVHDTCSHQQFSLAEGWVGDNEVECALHGSAFDLDTGNPTSLPAVKPVPVYACKVADGDVWVDLSQQLNEAPVPRH